MERFLHYPTVHVQVPMAPVDYHLSKEMTTGCHSGGRPKWNEAPQSHCREPDIGPRWVPPVSSQMTISAASDDSDRAAKPRKASELSVITMSAFYSIWLFKHQEPFPVL